MSIFAVDSKSRMMSPSRNATFGIMVSVWHDICTITSYIYHTYVLFTKPSPGMLHVHTSSVCMDKAAEPHSALVSPAMLLSYMCMSRCVDRNPKFT